jgi:hypothetical protein
VVEIVSVVAVFGIAPPYAYREQASGGGRSPMLRIA